MLVTPSSLLWNSSAVKPSTDPLNFNSIARTFVLNQWQKIFISCGFAVSGGEEKHTIYWLRTGGGEISLKLKEKLYYYFRLLLTVDSSTIIPYWDCWLFCLPGGTRYTLSWVWSMKAFWDSKLEAITCLNWFYWMSDI